MLTSSSFLLFYFKLCALPLSSVCHQQSCKKKQGKKEWMKRKRKRSKHAFEPKKRVFFLMDNLCHFLIEHRRRKREKEYRTKKVSDSLFTTVYSGCWWCLCWLLSDLMNERKKIDWDFECEDDMLKRGPSLTRVISVDDDDVFK